MTTHTCIRCGYEISKIGDMKKHLARQKICDPKENNDIKAFEEFKKTYFIEKIIIFKCNKCNKGFSSKYGHTVHVAK